MLDPGNRHLLTDALRPPSGFSVDAALATTYTVDLHTVLLAPLAMAAYDHAETTVDAATPVALLESVRRHAGHTTVLCQAGGIHVPASYPRLSAFAEGMVGEVAPPPGRTFHPKIWLLRFSAPDGDRLHRFVCLSRNLTGDRSWDTVLVCDEDPEAAYVLDGAPIAGWVTDVLSNLTRPLTPERRGIIDELCTGIAAARLAVPEPFTEARALPMGFATDTGWPLPASADAWAVISPFLETSALRRLPESSGRRVLLSRPEAFERVGRAAIAGAETLVLHALADLTGPDEADGEPTQHLQRRGSVPQGLHAKVFVWDEGDTSRVLTGSANCTGAAFGGNVEMSVLMSGPTAECGVDALLGDEDSGLLRITQPHSITASDPVVDPTEAIERAIEEWHVALAASRPVLHVSPAGEEFDLRLEFTLPVDPHGLAPRTVVKPVASAHAPRRPILEAAAWSGISLLGLSPYLLVHTATEVEGAEVERACVVICALQGAPEDRQRRLLRELLASQRDVLRYLMLLLGDLGTADLLEQLARGDETSADDSRRRSFGLGFDDLVLLEPLLRAAARGDDSLERAHRLLDDLRDDDGELPQLDAEFQQLWQVIYEGGRS